MKCPHCQAKARKHGRTRNGGQRFRCKRCLRTFVPHRAADKRMLSESEVEAVERLWFDGESLRTIARRRGITKDTAMRLGKVIMAQYLDRINAPLKRQRGE